MESCLVEMESCFKLLLPDAKNFEVFTPSGGDKERQDGGDQYSSTHGTSTADSNRTGDRLKSTDSELSSVAKEDCATEKAVDTDHGMRHAESEAGGPEQVVSPTRSATQSNRSPIKSPEGRRRSLSRLMSVSSAGDDDYQVRKRGCTFCLQWGHLVSPP